MHERHRALTASIAGSYQEAASVCLNRHHEPPVQIRTDDNGTEDSAEVTWITPSSLLQDAWANVIDTTEMGAYGCVLAGVEELRGLLALRRAETGTGADYYIGPAWAGQDDLEDCIRIEISGVDKGNDIAVKKRLLEKVRQASEGNSSLPALAGVIGFSARLLILKDVPDKS